MLCDCVRFLLLFVNGVRTVLWLMWVCVHAAGSIKDRMGQWNQKAAGGDDQWKGRENDAGLCLDTQKRT